jgi:riboflavin synthase
LFTGIIEELGIVQAFRPASGSASLTVEAPGIAIGMKPGDSIAVNGVCLTVTRANDRDFSFDLSAETLRRSSLGRLQRGMSVNLERPLAVGDRLGGHFVLGHVDGVGNLSTKVRSGDGCVLAFRFPRDLARYLVLKGSVAVDGISLTIASLEQESFSAAIIPHTLEVTNLKTLGPGDEVNLEVDILGKYFERFFQLGLLQERAEGLTFDYLRDQGF